MILLFILGISSDLCALRGFSHIRYNNPGRRVIVDAKAVRFILQCGFEYTYKVNLHALFKHDLGFGVDISAR